MNIDLYSDRAKQAVQSAQSLALARGHQQFAPEHILKVLLEEKDGLSRALVQSAGGRPDQLDGGVETLLAKTLSQLVGGEFRRIQFTPDLMASDVVGTSVFDLATSSFHTRTGPIFANVILADEINRAPAKTQAALLEAMEERQVTIEGRSHALPAPFIVLATQNPVEY